MLLDVVAASPDTTSVVGIYNMLNGANTTISRVKIAAILAVIWIEFVFTVVVIIFSF
jgi:hypothetical protein